MPKKKINSRDKGAVGERELANLLKGRGIEARRGQQFSGGGDSPDVVHDLGNFHIECKRVEALSLYKALAQADHDRKAKDVPVVMHRKNGKEWVAILYLEDFLNLLEE